MTYDDEVWDAVDDALDKFDFWYRDSVVRAAIEAIPPLTLKTEDGRFVKVEQYGWKDPGPRGAMWAEQDGINRRVPLYRIVEEP